MEDLSRRDFVGAAGVLGAMGVMGMMGAGASAAMAEPEEAAPLVKPADDSEADMYHMHTSLDTINELRRQVIDACEDYTCSDGTVIPAIWVKCRMLIDGLGVGDGAAYYTGDESFELYKRLCNSDEKVADIYVNSPIGVKFTVFDSAVSTGYTEDECKDALTQLSFNGALFHEKVADQDYYFHQRTAHGICESSMNLYEDDGYIDSFMAGINGMYSSPFPSYYPLPLNQDIVADESILPYDDIEALLNRHETFCVSPCQCRYLVNLIGQDRSELPNILDRDAIKDFVCADGHHLEKCVTFGEEAQFYIDQGIGRQLTRDECREILQRQIDEGCVLQSCYTKYTEVICCCDTGCGVLAGYKAAGVENPTYPNQSHYNLMYDKDACIQCGSCVKRCPAGAIEMDADGYPAVTGYCFRCGQCAYICPAGARKLKAKDADLIPDMPSDLLDWANKDVMFRYEKGLWPAEMAQPVAATAGSSSTSASVSVSAASGSASASASGSASGSASAAASASGSASASK